MARHRGLPAARERRQLRRRESHHGALLAATVAALVLASCGAPTRIAAPPAHSAAEREWIDNAASLIRTLDADVALSTVGGANLRAARRVLGDESAIYTLLVAYDLFGDCDPSLANAGTASARDAQLAQTLIGACGRLEQAATLFERALQRHDATALLLATRTVLTAVPLLSRASVELARL